MLQVIMFHPLVTKYFCGKGLSDAPGDIPAPVLRVQAAREVLASCKYHCYNGQLGNLLGSQASLVRPDGYQR